MATLFPFCDKSATKGHVACGCWGQNWLDQNKEELTSPPPWWRTSPAGSPISHPGLPSPEGRRCPLRKEESCTELLRKVLLPDSRERPRSLKLEAVGLAGSSSRGQSHLVSMGFRHVPLGVLRLPLPKLLTEVSQACFPWGLPSLRSHQWGRHGAT